MPEGDFQADIGRRVMVLPCPRETLVIQPAHISLDMQAT